MKSAISQTAEQITLEVSAQLSGRNLLQYQNFEDKTIGTTHVSASGGVLTMAFSASETAVFSAREIADTTLWNLARGRCLTLSGYYKVIKPFQSAAARLSGVWAYKSGASQTLHYNQNAALKLDEVSADWIYYEKTYFDELLDEELSNLGMMCEITPTKAETDGKIQWKDWKLKISTPVQSGNIRSKFAMDASSVTIDAGRLTFNSNTIVINSTNFKLDGSGNVTASGTFKSANDKWEATLRSGGLFMNYDGNQRVAIYKAGNYDAGYVMLTGVYDSETYNAAYSSDGINIKKDDTSIFYVNGQGGVNIGGQLTVASATTLKGSLDMPSDYNHALYLRRSKLQPCNGQNSLYCDWVNVRGTDGNSYWVLAGFGSYRGT